LCSFWKVLIEELHDFGGCDGSWVGEVVDARGSGGKDEMARDGQEFAEDRDAVGMVDEAAVVAQLGDEIPGVVDVGVDGHPESVDEGRGLGVAVDLYVLGVCFGARVEGPEEVWWIAFVKGAMSFSRVDAPRGEVRKVYAEPVADLGERDGALEVCGDGLEGVGLAPVNVGSSCDSGREDDVARSGLDDLGPHGFGV